jgi:hypothetical protein
MRLSFRPALPVERPAGPLRGHKLAYPMLSGDGQMAGFKGVWASAQPIYQVRDSAACFWNTNHSPPERRCGCGFYCFHSSEAAHAMACESQYRSSVILDVEISGRFIRYEEGFRYSDQRVLAVHLNRCSCGRPAGVLVDSGSGTTGWLQLQPCCLRCIGPKESISPARFGALLGHPGLVVTDATTADDEPGDWLPDAPTPPAGEADPSLSLLAAEVALLQARVDSLQAQLSRLTEQSG